MRAGRLRHRLIVEQPNVTRDDAGAEVPGWSVVATVWSGIEPLKGTENFQAGQILASVDTLIVVRWSPLLAAMSAKWRFRFPELTNPVTYNVQSVVHTNLGQREMRVMCASGNNQG